MALLVVDNPPNPWHGTAVDWIGPPPQARLRVYLDHTKSILSRNDSPDIGFTWSVNPYRGCFHGCAYCYARPSHEYLGFGAGTDFERRLVVKPDAPRLLAEALGKARWKGEVIVFSGNTDPYQPLEASYRITRKCLEVCHAHRQPVSLITKAPLVERDAELLARMHAVGYAAVTVSVPFADPDHARALEPTVPSPTRRLETIRRLAEAGVPVGVNVAPIIPGLSDSQLVEVLERAREAGAGWAGHTVVRLPGPVARIFEERVRATLPDRADRILERIRDVRGGKLNVAAFGARMSAQGVYGEAIRMLFRTTARRLGFGEPPAVPHPSPFRRPEAPRRLHQLDLF